MNFQAFARGERIRALIALEIPRHFRPVNPVNLLLMLLKVRLTLEGGVAHLAKMGSLLRVGGHVIFQIDRRREFFPAKLANVIFIRVVSFQMVFQTPRVFERARTFPAFVYSRQIHVNEFVRVIIGLEREFLPANIANVFFRARRVKGFPMSGQVVFFSENFIAILAFESVFVCVFREFEIVNLVGLILVFGFRIFPTFPRPSYRVGTFRHGKCI